MGIYQDIYKVQAYAETLCHHASVKTGKSFSVQYTNTRFPYTQEQGSTIRLCYL